MNRKNCIIRTEFSLIVLLLLAIGYLALSGSFPLVYDEAWNYLYLSEKGPFFVITNYPAPNNHVFYTLLQSILVPSQLLSFSPYLIRIPNLLWFLSLAFCVVAFSRKERLPAFCRVFLLYSLVFAAPQITLFLVLTRGYTLGILIFLLALWCFQQRKLYLASTVLAFSVYSNPLLALPAPGIFLALYTLKAFKIRFSETFLSALLFKFMTLALYSPILKEVLGQRHSFSAYDSLYDFITDLILFSSSLGPVAGFSAGLLFLLLCIFLGALSFFGEKRPITEIAQLLFLSAASSFTLLALFIVTGLISFPFLRAISFIPLFFQLAALFVLFTGLEQSNRRKAFFCVVLFGFTLNILSGVGLYANSYSRGFEKSLPFMQEMTPSPLPQLIRKHGRKIVSQGRVLGTEFQAPTLELYSLSYGLEYHIVTREKMEAICPKTQRDSSVHKRLAWRQRGSEIICSE